jgi:hypothetical protein
MDMTIALKRKSTPENTLTAKGHTDLGWTTTTYSKGISIQPTERNQSRQKQHETKASDGK